MKFDEYILKSLKPSVFERAAKNIALTVKDENNGKCACCCDAIMSYPYALGYSEDYIEFFSYVFNKKSNYNTWWPTPQVYNELNPNSQTARIIALTLTAIILREMQTELKNQ